uniref:Putative secreted protein n=1 Tax=Ixodes ricinus TaxID=34613 RepID=A0A6B0TUK7_IXORI
MVVAHLTGTTKPAVLLFFMPLMLLILTEGCSLFESCEADKSGFVFFGTSRKLFCVMEELLKTFSWWYLGSSL